VRLNHQQERDVHAQSCGLDVLLEILREASVREVAIRQLVLAEEEEEDCRRDADERDRAGETGALDGFRGEAQAISLVPSWESAPSWRVRSLILA
jgi:hypothetical protein